MTLWGKQAEAGSAYLTKGRAVAIEGRLQQDTWETEAGERRSRLKVVAQRVTFLSSAPGQPAPAGSCRSMKRPDTSDSGAGGQSAAWS